MLISSNAQKFLKILHLVAISCWTGGCLAMIILFFASTQAQTDDELFGVLRSFRFVNVLIVVYIGAMGSFFTGLAYSLCTNRGFFRHKWVILKWAMTLYLILCGSILLSPWSIILLETAEAMGVSALTDPEFLRVLALHQTFSIIEMALLILAIALSVYKPWERAELAAQRGIPDYMPE